MKFAAMECVQQTDTDVTEYIGGRCTSEGVKGGIGIPGLDSFLVGFSTDTKVIGLDSVPPDDRPPAFGEMIEQLFKLRFQMAMGQSESLNRIRELRKDRARLLTILKEKETE